MWARFKEAAQGREINPLSGFYSLADGFEPSAKNKGKQGIF
jgi:hypothetical protein